MKTKRKAILQAKGTDTPLTCRSVKFNSVAEQAVQEARNLNLSVLGVKTSDSILFHQALCALIEKLEHMDSLSTAGSWKSILKAFQSDLLAMAGKSDQPTTKYFNNK